jgi:hypothetical protein
MSSEEFPLQGGTVAITNILALLNTTYDTESLTPFGDAATSGVTHGNGSGGATPTPTVPLQNP